MRGDRLTQRSGEERRWGDRPIFLQRKGWVQNRPPHPSPSVTASPKGKPLGCLYPTPHEKRPKSGHVDGVRTAPSTGTMRHNRQNERVPTSGHKEGRATPRFLASGLSLESPGSTAPGPGGETTAGYNLRRSQQDLWDKGERQRRSSHSGGETLPCHILAEPHENGGVWAREGIACHGPGAILMPWMMFSATAQAMAGWA